MKIFKNRAVAVLLCVLIVIASTLLSTNVKLGREADGVSDGFYKGVTYDGYKHPAISDQLNNICGAADGLASLVAKYGYDVVTLKQCSVELKSMLDQRSSAYTTVYAKFRELLDCIETLKLEYSGLGLSERDTSGVEQYFSTVSSASEVIGSAGYNDSVQQFKRSYLDRFPGSILAKLAGVDAPELFARA